MSDEVAVGEADQLRFSIVIPARNEEKDIGATLDLCLEIDYPEKEIIVVDDSDDDTPKVVERFASRGVKLVHRERPENGCCGARRVGMQVATGDVVVLMNADNRPAPDFLRRLAALYENGADFVVVQSRVMNMDRWIPRYIAFSDSASPSKDPLWSEGFSARRAALEAVGWVPGDFPVKFCRDHRIAANLVAAGYRRVLDRSIVMEHVSPDNLGEYWRNQKWRGSFSSPYAFFVEGTSFARVTFREVAKLGRGLLRLGTVVPLAVSAFKAARFCSNRFVAAGIFTAIAWIQEAAFRIGGIQGYLALSKFLRSQG